MINKYWIFSAVVLFLLYWIYKNLRGTNKPGFMSGFFETLIALFLVLILIIFLLAWGGVYWW